MLGHKFHSFQLHNDICMDFNIIEEKVYIVIIIIHLQSHLFSIIAKTSSKFNKKLGHTVTKMFFQFLFIMQFAQVEEIEHIWVLYNLTG